MKSYYSTKRLFWYAFMFRSSGMEENAFLGRNIRRVEFRYYLF